jgi:hypothetical protein
VLAVHAGGYPPGRDVDDDVRRASRLRRDVAGVDGPRPERDRPVAAGRREAVLVPEEDAERRSVASGGVMKPYMSA